MHTTTRRKFLQAISAATASTAGLVAVSSTVPLFLARSAAMGAEQAGERILVVVQLSGGNDGLNTVIPFKDERYRAARPSLVQSNAAVLSVDSELGLHPSLKGFAKLLEASQLSIVQGVGYPNPNRSHFESMDIWHTAHTDLMDRRDGWLGRCSDLLKSGGATSPTTMHLGAETQPLAVVARDTPTPSVRSLEQFRLDSQLGTRRSAIESAAAAPRTGPSDLLQFVTTRTTSALELSSRLESATSAYKTPVNYPAYPLAEKLKQIAQLIDAGLATRIYYVTLDGFDTHSDQAAAHAALLTQLGDSLAAFTDDLQQHGHLDRVATLVFSEFGRRLQENSSRGTDHGAAAPLFLIGNQIRPGLIGKHPDLGALDDGDVKHHTDFRNVYASLLSNWLAAPADKILGASFRPLDIWKS
jgi:uncharacterized protein (DUF1501 family)